MSLPLLLLSILTVPAQGALHGPASKQLLLPDAYPSPRRLLPHDTFIRAGNAVRAHFQDALLQDSSLFIKYRGEPVEQQLPGPSRDAAEDHASRRGWGSGTC
jgi:hypothetical protein